MYLILGIMKILFHKMRNHLPITVVNAKFGTYYNRTIHVSKTNNAIHWRNIIL